MSFPIIDIFHHSEQNSTTKFDSHDWLSDAGVLKENGAGTKM